jgi:hypothetical protein
MSFFHQIHNLDEPLHITLDIMKKGDKLIIAVTPHSKTALRHVQLTGTPAELADGFFDQIKLQEGAAGLQVQDLPNADGKAETPTPATSKPVPAAKVKKAKPIKKQAEPKTTKANVKKGSQPVERSMFDTDPEQADKPADTPAEEPTDQEVDEQLSKETE